MKVIKNKNKLMVVVLFNRMMWGKWITDATNISLLIEIALNLLRDAGGKGKAHGLRRSCSSVEIDAVNVLPQLSWVDVCSKDMRWKGIMEGRCSQNEALNLVASMQPRILDIASLILEIVLFKWDRNVWQEVA